MLIRSQDKETLINMDRIALIDALTTYDSGDTHLFAFSMSDIDYDEGCDIGFYPTMSDAKKVLDMIERTYKIDRQFVPVTVGSGPSAITQFVSCQPQIFQMPEYEEVDDVSGG